MGEEAFPRPKIAGERDDWPVLVCGIDGTGTHDAVVCTDRPNLFVHRFVNSIPTDPLNKRYYLGPNDSGNCTATIIQSAVDFLTDRVEQMGGARIILVGWSRGAYACIQLADILRTDKITRENGVNFLGLLDAVERHIDIGKVEEIPENVVICRHAIRSSDSRVYFGNTGLRAPESVDFKVKPFMTSHAGMGGTPWPQGAHLGEESTWPTFLMPYSEIRSPYAQRTNELQRKQMLSLNFHPTFGTSPGDIEMEKSQSEEAGDWLWQEFCSQDIVPEINFDKKKLPMLSTSNPVAAIITKSCLRFI